MMSWDRTELVAVAARTAPDGAPTTQALPGGAKVYAAVSAPSVGLAVTSVASALEAAGPCLPPPFFVSRLFAIVTAVLKEEGLLIGCLRRR